MQVENIYIQLFLEISIKNFNGLNVDIATRNFCKEAATYIRDFSDVRDLTRKLDGPTKEQAELLIEIDFLCNSFAASILTLSSEEFYNEAITLRRTLLEGQTKFLYLFLHELGFETAFWEYTQCLPHISMELQVKKLNRRKKIAEENNFQGNSARKQQVAQMEDELQFLYKGLRHNKKIYSWPKDKPNPLSKSDAVQINRRWETQYILEKITTSGVLKNFPIQELFSISSAIHHFAAESIPLGMAEHIKNGTRLNGSFEDNAEMIRECILFGAYRQFTIASRIRGGYGKRLKKNYLEVIRKANELGFIMPMECMGPYKIVKSSGSELTLVLGDLADD